LAFCSFLTVFQVWQFHVGLIWSEYENRAHFWEMFGKTQSSRAALVAWSTNERQPTTSPVLLKKLGENTLDDSTGVQFVREPRHGGNFSLKMDDQEYGGEVLTNSGDLKEARPGDWIRVSVWAYVPGKTKNWDQFSMANLILMFYDGGGKPIRDRGLRIAPQIGNPEGSIWNAGAGDQWGEAAYFVRVPDNFPPNGTVKGYVWNSRREKLMIDDLSLELWRQ
jgi:hypothetical protein